LNEKHLRVIFNLINDKTTAKESTENIIEWLCVNKGKSVGDALNVLGLRMLSSVELEKKINEIIEKNRQIVQDLGTGASGIPLRGVLMLAIKLEESPTFYKAFN
jgi:Glu-tRNA(Gln) amidotransferase subunit E-like FAD-binding protein